MNDSLFEYDRDLGRRYVCGADESGRGCWAGPLVIAAVRFDYDQLDTNTVARLAHLNDSKNVTPRRRAALLPVILEVADIAAIVVVSAAEIDRDGSDEAHMRALGRALEAVAVAESVNLVDWFDLQGAGASARRVEHGDRTSAAIAASSIVAKETHDQLMRGLNGEYPGYGFATHKGYGTPGHEAALVELGPSPEHRRRAIRTVYARLGLSPPA